MLTAEEYIFRRENCPSDSLSTTDPTWAPPIIMRLKMTSVVYIQLLNNYYPSTVTTNMSQTEVESAPEMSYILNYVR